MKETDYSKIADKYDNNPIRYQIPIDRNIEHLLTSSGKGIIVLDLACGTANYLLKQISEYEDKQIKWFGLDKSPQMLQKAKSKGMNATFIIGDAACIPLEDKSIDYIKNRFAFHHFTDKRKVVQEMYRILKKNGVVSLYNLGIDYFKSSWVYKYFPQVEEYDKERFPSSNELYQWFDNAGFETAIRIKTIIRKIYFKEIIKETLHRDMSQLNIISDEEYEFGLEKMKNDSCKYEYLIGDISYLDLYGKKR